VEKKSMDELTIETVKQSVEYIKNTLREQQITALVKIKGYKIGSKIQYTIKFMDRIYLEDFDYDKNFLEITKKVLSKINGFLKTEESYPTQSMNHQQRRSHLKNSYQVL
jgi:hypothetical protein